MKLKILFGGLYDVLRADLMHENSARKGYKDTCKSDCTVLVQVINISLRMCARVQLSHVLSFVLWRSDVSRCR